MTEGPSAQTGPAIRLRYRIVPDGHEAEQISLTIDDRTLTAVDISLENYGPADQEMPAWAALDYHQCSHCPLGSDTHPVCPVARNLVPVLPYAAQFNSFDRVTAVYVNDRRNIAKKTDAQEVFGALIGLLVATSGCPHTEFLKPMARFHLPFADFKETIYRILSMYSVAQHFRAREGLEVDLGLDGLRTLYANLGKMNAGVAERIRSASKKDSSINALVILDNFARRTLMALEDQELELEHYFEFYLQP